MSLQAFQDYYDDYFSQCYGCGRLNEHSLKIKSYWDENESVCRFHPKPYHTAIPGFVYGGLIASVIDCHAIGTAAAATYRHEGRQIGTEPKLRYLTASLHVDYLKPTPIDAPMELRAKVKAINTRKVVVSVTLTSKGQICAQGEVVAVRVPDKMNPK
jgi:acyl-coenzyme A thioesterase PaaI-like protein